MAKNKEGRPEWFKFWRYNRQLLDIEQLSIESRGVVFTNMMRYFDGEADALLPMTTAEAIAFNVLKRNVDESFSDYDERKETNRINGEKGGRPPKTEGNQMGFVITEKTRREKTEERSQKIEVERGRTSRAALRASQPPRLRKWPITVRSAGTVWTHSALWTSTPRRAGRSARRP